MFGYDEAQLSRERKRAARARRPFYARAAVVATEILLALGCGVLVVLLALINRPQVVLHLVQRAFPDAPLELSFDEVEVLPVGSLWHPSQLQLAATGITFAMRDPVKPDGAIHRVGFHIPAISLSPGPRFAFQWRKLEAWGVYIYAHQQRPPPEWTASQGVISLLATEQLLVHSVVFDAPADDPLPPVRVERTWGEFHDVRFDPGAVDVNGTGMIRLGYLKTGNVTVTDVEVDDAVIEHSSLTFSGTFRFGGSKGTLKGNIEQFNRRAKVEIDLVLNGANLKRVVQTATDQASPVAGTVYLNVKVRAGGELARGCSQIDGKVTLRDGRILLAPDTSYLVLDAIRIAPWMRLNAFNEVVLADASGNVTVQRGTFTLKELQYNVKRGTIEINGKIGGGITWLLVHLKLNANANPDKLGLAVAYLDDGVQKRARLAGREDVLRPQPWEPPSDVRSRMSLPCQASSRGVKAATAPASSSVSQ